MVCGMHISTHRATCNKKVGKLVYFYLYCTPSQHKPDLLHTHNTNRAQNDQLSRSGHGPRSSMSGRRGMQLQAISKVLERQSRNAVGPNILNSQFYRMQWVAALRGILGSWKTCCQSFVAIFRFILSLSSRQIFLSESPYL